MASVRIPLNSRKYPGLFALIDEEDYELVSQRPWHPLVMPHSYTFYAQTYFRKDNGVKSKLSMHRFILDPRQGEVVDHIDRNGLNNTRSNLRIATSSQNNANRRIADGYTSVYLGVHRLSRGDGWCAMLRHAGESFNLGSFDSEEVAARVRDMHARKHFGEFARLNFPHDVWTDEATVIAANLDNEVRAKRTGRGRSVILTETDVLEIVRLSQLGWRTEEIQKKFGCHEATIRRILRGRTWSGVTGIQSP